MLSCFAMQASGSTEIGSSKAERSDETSDGCETHCKPSSSSSSSSSSSMHEMHLPPCNIRQSTRGTDRACTAADMTLISPSPLCCGDTSTLAAAHDSVQQVAFAERTANEMAEMVHWWYHTSPLSAAAAAIATAADTTLLIPQLEPSETERKSKDQGQSQARSLPNNSLLWNEQDEKDDHSTMSEQVSSGPRVFSLDLDDPALLLPTRQTLDVYDSCIAELWHVTNDVATSRHRIDTIHSALVRGSSGGGDCGDGSVTKRTSCDATVAHWDETLSTTTPNLHQCYPETLSMPSPMLTEASLSSQTPSLGTTCSMKNSSLPTYPLLQHILPRQPWRTKEKQIELLSGVDRPDDNHFTSTTTGRSSQAYTTTETYALHRQMARLQLILMVLCLVVVLLSWQMALMQHQLHTMAAAAAVADVTTSRALTPETDWCSVSLPSGLAQATCGMVDDECGTLRSCVKK